MIQIMLCLVIINRKHFDIMIGTKNSYQHHYNQFFEPCRIDAKSWLE